MINVDEKLTKNVKMKKIVEKRFSKKKKNSDTMMLEIVNMKNSNAKSFYKISHRWHDYDFKQLHEIFFRIREFFKERERGAEAREKVKKKIEKERERELSREEEEEDKWMNFFYLTFI